MGTIQFANHLTQSLRFVSCKKWVLEKNAHYKYCLIMTAPLVLAMIKPKIVSIPSWLIPCTSYVPRCTCLAKLRLDIICVIGAH